MQQRVIQLRNPGLQLESLEDLQDSVNEVVDILVDGSPKRSRAYALNQ